MKILLLGATGRTGKLVIEEALKKGHEVSAIARDPAKLKEFNIEITIGTPYDYETVEKAITGCEAVVNTLNVSRKSDNPWSPLRAPKDMISRSALNAIKAMEKTGIKRFVALSTLGAGRSWNNFPGFMKFMVSISNMKPAFIDHGRQEELLEKSSLDFTVCRAPILSDEPNDKGVVARPEGEPPANRYLSRRSAAAFFIRIIESGEYMRQFVSLANDH
jgi:uncharacterized protein YbjT (DUF2867 family)